MNHNRREFNRQNNVVAATLSSMPYRQGVNCGYNGIEAAARVWGILGIYEDIHSHDVDASSVSEKVYTVFYKLMSGIKKEGFDTPEKISLLENGRVRYDAVDSSLSPYIKVTPSKSGKTLQVTYRTHEYSYESCYYKYNKWSNPKSFPIDTSWEMIVNSLGNDVNSGDTTFENYQPD